ncbi:MAG: nuclear transport factor 2 family protein [Pseudomonadota bacterium]
MSAQIPSENWVRQYFSDVDSRDIDRILQYYAADARFRFGNNEPAVGTDAIAAALRGFFEQIDGIQHASKGIWLGDHDAVFEAEVHFQVGDANIAVPAVSILRLDRTSKIADFRFVMDAQPVFDLIE